MKKKILALILALILVVCCFAACGTEKASDGNVSGGDVSSADENKNSSDTGTDEDEKDKVEPFFADFTTTTIKGKEASQETLKGNKLTMVNIWGTFCSPCINEMPDLQKLSEEYADRGFEVIGIVCDTYDYIKGENDADKIKKAEDILKQTGVKYTNLLPSESLNSAKLNYVNTIPATYFLNEDGEIVTGEYIGSRSYDQWADIIEGLLQAE